MNRYPRKRYAIKSYVLGLSIYVLIFASIQNLFCADVEDHPNILWLVSEDNGRFLGCYGDKNASTPNLDALAREGLLYKNAFANAPVCAPMRNSIITGVHASISGCQNMRSKNMLPPHIRFFPEYLRKAGYYCSNNAKEDYNTINTGNIWDESSRSAHYKNRKPGQPFFAIFNTNLSHEHKIHYSNLIDTEDLLHDPAEMELAPYHPDLPEIRQSYATYYDYITRMDTWIGEKLKELEESGLAENTIVFYYSDHAGVLPRSKRFVYDSGTHIPLIIRIPEKYRHLAPALPGQHLNRLVSLVDLPPTMLSLLNIEVPEYMTGKAFLGKQRTADPEYVHFFRQRMDERYDMMRAIRDKQYRYIRNYMPHRIYGQHLYYLWRSPATRVWEADCNTGNCDDIQNRFWQVKEVEELYDTQSDPHNIKNLAGDPAYRGVLERMRQETKRWVRENRDSGFLPEAMMVERANDSSIYEHIHQMDFPIEKIIETAEIASEGDEKYLPDLIRRLSDDEPAVRYWAATGCAILGRKAREATQTLLLLLEDPYGDTRIAAAEALCRIGHKDEALQQLVNELQNDDQRIILRALNALDAIGDDALPVIRQIMEGPAEADNYCHRALVQLIKKLKPGWEDYTIW